jgi:hypothetical protein
MNAANQANQAGYGAGTQNLASGLTTQNDIIGGYQNYGQLGAQQMNQGYNMGTGNLGLALDSGGIRQAYDQSLIDADRERYDFSQNAYRNNLFDKFNMYNTTKLNGTPGTTGTSALEGGVQGLQAGLGFLDWYNNRQLPGGGTVGAPNTVDTGGWQRDPNDPYGWNGSR